MSDIGVHLKTLEEQQAKLAIEKELALNTALTSGSVDEIYKARLYYNNFYSNAGRKNSPNSKGKSITIDPLENSGTMGYFDKVGYISYPVLRNMGKVPIIRSIIATRKEQVADYCIPQEDRYSKGFVIRKKTTAIPEDGDGDPKDLNDNEKRVIDELTKFLLEGGESDEKWVDDDFETFIRKIVEDSLSMDQACFEIIPNRKNEPYSFKAVDAATFRFADTIDEGSNTPESEKVNGHYPAYVQIYQGNIVAEYYPWELCFGLRNPQTNIYGNGYGRSELEDLVTTVTAMLHSDQYNANFFRNGTAPKGALMVKKAGGLNSDVISEFRREWNAQMVGPANMHKTPILDAEHMEWLDLQKTNRDMEFSKYQEYLIKLSCAVYKISPEEIGFPVQGSLGKSGGGLGGGRGAASEERDYSMDKGLKPLLRKIARWINKYLIGPKTDDVFEFAFIGLDAETSVSEESRLILASKSYLEVNEVRKLKGLQPLAYGDIILDPIAAQAKLGGNAPVDVFTSFTENNESEKFTNGLEDNGNPMAKSFESYLDQLIEIDK